MTRPEGALPWMDDSEFSRPLGENVWWSPLTREIDGVDHDYGIRTLHRCTATESGWNAGAAMFDLPHNADLKAQGRPAWTVVSLDPLHIEPSLQHKVYRDGRHENDPCPLGHGFIRGGKWVAA